MPTVHLYNTRTELNEGFTAFMLRLLEDKPLITVALSGGSTPQSLFDYWATERRGDIPWHKIRFYWGDERCVPPSDEMSNYGMTKKHLLDPVGMPAGNIFRIIGENDPQAEAARYGSILPDAFDLIMLGLGEDGHTASIFPGSIQLWDSPANCVVAAHPDTGMLRVSFTGKVINSAHYVAFLATGKSKAGKVDAILRHPSADAVRYPAARVAPSSGKLYWFLDKEAYG